MALFRKLLALLASTVALAAAPSAFAQCVYNGVDGFDCSGNVGGTTLIGTVGNDRFVFADGATGVVTMSSGGGADTIDLSAFTTPVSVSLSESGQQVVNGAGLQFILDGFNAPGQTYRLLGGSAGDILIGAAGNDILTGGGGADTLDGELGTDTRADTLLADCAGDTLSSIEVDFCAAPVPTVSDWTMILLALLLAGGAALYLQRRQIGLN